MEDLKLLFDSIIDYFQIQFTVYGYTFSLWTLFIYLCLVSFVLFLLGIFIRSVFYD